MVSTAQNPFGRFALAGLFFGLLACGPDTRPDPDPDPDPIIDDDPDPGDVTPPTVVFVTPAPQEAGVLPDVVIVVGFSEPMDGASVEAAYASSSLPPDAVEMSWNGAGDRLTIRPKQPLGLNEGEGVIPQLVPLVTYSFVLGTAARDRAGNALQESFSTSFTTARRLTASFEPDEFLTRTVIVTDPVTLPGEPKETLLVGDSSADGVLFNSPVRSVLTFDFGLLPFTTVEIEAASIQSVVEVTGDLAGLGDLLAHHVVYEAVDAEAADGEPMSTSVVTLGEGSSFFHEVTDPVRDDFEHRNERSDRSQYRLEFENTHNGDNSTDRLHIGYGRLRLFITYLSE